MVIFQGSPPGGISIKQMSAGLRFSLKSKVSQPNCCSKTQGSEKVTISLDPVPLFHKKMKGIQGGKEGVERVSVALDGGKLETDLTVFHSTSRMSRHLYISPGTWQESNVPDHLWGPVPLQQADTKCWVAVHTVQEETGQQVTSRKIKRLLFIF